MAYTLDLSGRVAFVSGAAGALGAQAARVLAQAGAAVVLAGQRMDDLRALRAQIDADGGDAHVVDLDVTRAASVRAAVAHAETEVGSLDILVNATSISHTAKLKELAERDLDDLYAVNVKGAFLLAQEVGRRMIARAQGAAPGGFTGGRIVNLASTVGMRAVAQLGAYSMMHAAVIQMTKAMALEWGRYGINVNAVCPGFMDLDTNHSHWATEAGEKLKQSLPRKRVGQPQDLNALLVMLCADESHFINGAVVVADDGFNA